MGEYPEIFADFSLKSALEIRNRGICLACFEIYCKFASEFEYVPVYGRIRKERTVSQPPDRQER